MPSPIRSRAERSRLVVECRASGLSAQAFARSKGIPPSTLYQWLTGASRSAPMVRIARVVYPTAESAGARAQPKTPVLIHLHGARVEVAADCDRPTLAHVLDLLDALARRVGR